MQRSLLPVLSLLLGTAFLLAGNGLHGLLLPMRGTEEGFSPTSLGLLGTAWATGFVLGCIFSQRLVRRIGHVRAFSAFSAMIAIIALLTGSAGGSGKLDHSARGDRVLAGSRLHDHRKLAQ
jgi:MFS family permease